MSIPKSVILSGATGFVGREMLNSIISQGFNVVAISRYPELQNDSSGITWVGWNEYTSIDFQKSNICAVINLAISYGHGDESESEVYAGNVTLPFQLFRYCIESGVHKIINADTFSGRPEHRYKYMQSYHQTKNELVSLTKDLVNSNDTCFINMRLEHVFGPNDGPNKFISKLISELKMGSKSIALTNGEQKRDFIYIYDVVDAFMSVLDHKFHSGFHEFEVGTGKCFMLKEFCIKLAEAFSVSTKVLKFGELDMRENEIMESVADIKDLNDIGWYPKWSLTKAIEDLAKKHADLHK